MRLASDHYPAYLQLPYNFRCPHTGASAASAGALQDSVHPAAKGASCWASPVVVAVMEGAGGPRFERLHDSLALAIISRLTERHDMRSLAQTSKRLCRLVRISRRCNLWLMLRDMQLLPQMPADRAFEEIHFLGVDVEEADLKEGCWEDLGRFFADCVQRWPGIESARIGGDERMEMEKQPAGCLGAAFAGLKGAANLKQLTLFQIADTSDLPHLEQLSQVTYLYLGTQPGTSMPLVLDDPPSAPLAALGNLKELQLPWGWCLTGEDAHTTFNDYNCPLAFPPNLTSLQAVWVECSAGALWRHIAACTALEELELSEDGDGARSHPSWALRELAGGLGRLRKLVIKHDGIEGARNPVRRLRQLVHLLYLPQEENVAPGALEAALALALPPMPVAGLQAADAANHMMLPPPNMEKFSSLEVLQLPGGTHGGWWLMASAPHHWQALAGCKALRQLEGLHASLPPPAEVKFPGVTRLEVTVAPGDALRVLGAFPALRELKITSVVAGDQQQEEPAAPLPVEQQQQQQLTERQQLIARQLAAAAAATPAPPAPKPPVFAGVKQLALDLDPLFHPDPSSSSGGASQAAAAYCSTLWKALPGVTALELEWPKGMALPSLVPVTELSSLVLNMPHWRPGSVEEQGSVVPAVLGMLSGAPGLQQLVVRMQVGEGNREGVEQEVRAVLPGLVDLQLKVDKLILSP